MKIRYFDRNAAWPMQLWRAMPVAMAIGRIHGLASLRNSDVVMFRVVNVAVGGVLLWTAGAGWGAA